MKPEEMDRLIEEHLAAEKEGDTARAVSGIDCEGLSHEAPGARWVLRDDAPVRAARAGPLCGLGEVTRRAVPSRGGARRWLLRSVRR